MRTTLYWKARRVDRLEGLGLGGRVKLKWIDLKLTFKVYETWIKTEAFSFFFQVELRRKELTC
jgi:hypothetical protein